jgi:hypothetical protein
MHLRGLLVELPFEPSLDEKKLSENKFLAFCKIPKIQNMNVKIDIFVLGMC